MSLNLQQLEDARALLSSGQDLRSGAVALRTQYPELRTLVVDAFDMRDETPAWQAGERALYYVATNGHCWSVTHDPEQASGFILAQR